MKRCFLFFCILSVIFLYGCTNLVSVSQSRLNFITYEDSLQKIADNNNLILTKSYDSNDLFAADIDYEINISETQNLYINFSNYVSSENDRGAERYYIVYSIDNSTETFDIDLIVSIINEISGKEITKEYVERFLSTLKEESYEYDDYGSDEVYEYHPLNFFEDWSISYWIQSDGCQELTFEGLTIASV